MNLVIAAVAFAFGVYMSSSISIFAVVLIFVSLLFVISVCNILHIGGNKYLLFIVVIFAAGCAAGKAAATDEFSELKKYEGHYITIEGRICELPQDNGNITKYIIDARHVNASGVVYDIDEKLVVSMEEKFDYNETVSCSGIIKSFPKALNENGFDVSQYYKMKHISVRMYAEEAYISDNKISSYTPYALATGVRYSISQLIDKYYTGDFAAVLKAVIIGDKKSFSEDFEQILYKTGTKRLFYPAFLHVMLMCTTVGLLSNFVGKRKRDIILICCCIIYAVLNCNQSSCIKAGLIAAVVILSKRMYGTAYMPDIIAAVVLVVGVTNPLTLMDSGFIMSVTATIMINAFYPIFKKRVKSKSKLIRVFILYGICSIGLLPFCAYYYGGVSVYSIIAQLIFLPLAAFIIAVSPIFLILLKLTGSGLFAGWLINTAVYIMLAVPPVINKLFLNYIALAVPAKTVMIAYFVMCGGIYYHFKEKYNKRAICMAMALGLFINGAAMQLERLGTAEINFVNVGQGDGALIQMPFRENILIDGGGSGVYSEYDIGTNVYVPFLKSKGVDEVETAFVSHYHKDHVQGIVAAVNNLHVRNLFMPDSLPENEWRKKLEAAADENGTKIWYISEDTKILYDSGLEIDIIMPKGAAELSDDENDTSVMMNVRYGEFNCLFTGDMTKLGEICALQEGKVPQAEVLKVAHHGSGYSSSEEMIETVNPYISVISVGEDNQYGLPREETLERLSNSRIYRTDKNGNIEITADEKGIKNIEVYKGEFGYGET